MYSAVYTAVVISSHRSPENHVAHSKEVGLPECFVFT